MPHQVAGGAAATLSYAERMQLRSQNGRQVDRHAGHGEWGEGVGRGGDAATHVSRTHGSGSFIMLAPLVALILPRCLFAGAAGPFCYPRLT